MPTPSPEVLIAGAGPAGLVLALTLVHNGISVQIIDKLGGPGVGQKGAGISPRSLEVYKFLDVVPDIIWEGRHIAPMRMYKLPGGTEPARTWLLSERSAPKPSIPYPNSIQLGQDRLEALLRSHLEGRGCHVEMGTELIGFEQEAEKVVAHLIKKTSGQEVPETIEVKFLVGADGAKGIVRKQLGLKFLGETREEESVITADVHVEGLDNDHWHMWKNNQDEVVLLRPTERWDNVFTLMCGGSTVDHAKLTSDPQALVKFIRSVTQREDLRFGEFVWLSVFRPNIRMVDTFGIGRVFVAGDAAHVHSPTGGQGMNSSIQDSFNLGWKLALVCKGHSPLRLLTTYSEERIPVIAEMLQVTTQILNKTMSRTSDEQSAWARGGALLQLGINYRWSSIVVDERVSYKEVTDEVLHAYGDKPGDEHEVVRAGDRAPDAPGLISRFSKSSADHPSSLFQVFRPTFHTILIFTKHPGRAADIANFLQQLPRSSVHSVAIVPGTWGYGPHIQFDDVDAAFIDVHGYAYKHYGIESEEMKVVVIRPDAMVGAVVSGVDGLERYFGNIFTQ